ncbi:hypothetical protein BaRGS_00022901 [Batillaria attramentaria]|uniref:C3H1-type domain-containing protein n=1 Tax=Batillaria attramentaria TaxID=370345 RepID=A0ABD0KFE5_9CAEN
MKTVPGSNLSSGIFPSSAMATEQMADIYRWLSEQLSEIGLEEFHVRSIVAYFFMNLQDLEDESSQDCGASPTSNNNGRRQTGFEVIPLEDRRKRCAELYIKNVSSKDSVPLAIVKKIVAELSTRLTTGAPESASSCSSQEHETRSPDYNSDSPMDRYNKAFPPLSEDNSPTQLSPPDDRDNVWTQRRPLTSKLAGETSQKNGAINRQPQAGTKRDTPSKKTKTSHGKENELSAKRKTHPGKRRDLIQYSYTARQLSYPVPEKPSTLVEPTSQEDEEEKTRIAEYLITALGIKSSGDSRRAQFSGNPPPADVTFSHKPSAPRCQKNEKEKSSGSFSKDSKTLDPEARLPAHMFPEQHASSEQSCSDRRNGVVKRDVASMQGKVPQPKQNTFETVSGRSAFFPSPASDAQVDRPGVPASHMHLQPAIYQQSLELGERRPQTEVTITADQRHMFAAFSPKDEALASQDACYRILPYEILERETKKEEETNESSNFDFCPYAHAADIPHQPANPLNSRRAEDDAQVMSTSLPHTFHSKLDTRADASTTSSEMYNSSSVNHHSRATLKESFSYPTLELSSLDLMPEPAEQRKKEDLHLPKAHGEPQFASELHGTTHGSTQPVVHPTVFHPQQADLGQWIQYLQSLRWSEGEPDATSQPYTSCQACTACLGGAPRWCQNSRNQNACSAASCEGGAVSDVSFTLGDYASSQETGFPSYCSSQEADSSKITDHLDFGACYATASEIRTSTRIPPVKEQLARELFESAFPGMDFAGYPPYAAQFALDDCDPGMNFSMQSTHVPAYEDAMDPSLNSSSYLHNFEADHGGGGHHVAFGQNSERRRALCKVYSPLKVEGGDPQETQPSASADIMRPREDQISPAMRRHFLQKSQVCFDERCIERHSAGEDDMFPTLSNEFDKYSHSIWSNDDGTHPDHPSLSLSCNQPQESGQHLRPSDIQGWTSDNHHHPALMPKNRTDSNSAEGSPAATTQGGQHPYPQTSKCSKGGQEVQYGDQASFMYERKHHERQSPFGYGTDMHQTFPSFHHPNYGSSDPYLSCWEANGDRELSPAQTANTASSSLPETAGTVRGTNQGSLSEDLPASWVSHFGKLSIQQSHARAAVGRKSERYQGDQAEHHPQLFQVGSDPELQSSLETSSDTRFQWQAKQGLHGLDFFPSPSTGKDEDWSCAADPMQDQDTWFSPWLPVHSNSTQSRIFPLLHVYGSKHKFQSKGSPLFNSLPYSPTLNLPLDRSASDSILSIPSDASAFRRYVRSSSLPSLESAATSAPQSTLHLPEIPRKESMTPRERQFQPIPALQAKGDVPSQQQSATVIQSAPKAPSPVIQLQDIFGTPTPTEVLSRTDKAIQTGEEYPAPLQRTIYPSLSGHDPSSVGYPTDDEERDPLSPPSTDSDISSDDDRPAKPELREKIWKDMQDVTDEDRYADAIYYYHQYGTMPHVVPSPQEVKEDLTYMEQAAATDFHLSHDGQMNGYIPSCAVPIPQQALHVEQLEEEMFQSTMDSRAVYSSHRPRRKPSKGSSKSKQPRGPVYSNKPCSFYLEGQCYRADCKYSHDMSSITCCFWQVAVQSVVELTSEEFPELSSVSVTHGNTSSVTQDFPDASAAFHKKKKVKKSGVRNQIPRGN